MSNNMYSFLNNQGLLASDSLSNLCTDKNQEVVSYCNNRAACASYGFSKHGVAVQKGDVAKCPFCGVSIQCTRMINKDNLYSIKQRRGDKFIYDEI